MLVEGAPDARRRMLARGAAPDPSLTGATAALRLKPARASILTISEGPASSPAPGFEALRGARARSATDHHNWPMGRTRHMILSA